MQLLNFIFFIILVILVFYLPGRLILRISGFKFGSFVITLTSSLVTGISLFLLGTYILSWFNLAILYNLVIPIAAILEFKYSHKELRQLFKNINNIVSWESLLIIVGSAAMTYLTWNSGVYYKDGLYFYGVNGGDSIYLLALIGSLISHFPPVHPGLSGVEIQGYHFFYEFLISNFVKFYNLNILDLFFRYFPLMISILFGLSALSLSKFLKWKKVTTILFLFLMYFAQSFDFFAYYIYRFFNFYYNSAGITQSFANALDPSVILSIIFIFIGFILLFSKHTKWSFLAAVLVIGVIPQIKIYSGILFYTGLGVVALMQYMKNKSLYYFLILFLSGLVSAFVYLPINYGAGNLIWAPLLIYKNFIDSAWIFNNWHWNVNYVIFAQHNNYIHLAFFYVVAISIFIITGMGIRISVLLSIKRIFQRDLYSLQNVFWLSSIAFSFLIPSFFIQSISTFQTIQFFWVGYILMIIPTALVLGSKLEKAGKWMFVGAVLLIAILFLPDTIKILSTYSTNPGIDSPELVSQASVMKNIPQNEGILVVNIIKVKGKYQDVFLSPIFSALSGHSIYYEHELTEFQGIGNIVDIRKKNIELISDNIVFCKNPSISEDNILKIMNSTNNKYLLVLKKTGCLSEYKSLKIINNTENTVLYKI